VGCGAADYIGLAKPRLQHMVMVATINLVKIVDRYGGIPVAVIR
jgi:hypothetical protein